MDVWMGLIIVATLVIVLSVVVSIWAGWQVGTAAIVIGGPFVFLCAVIRQYPDWRLVRFGPAAMERSEIADGGRTVAETEARPTPVPKAL